MPVTRYMVRDPRRDHGFTVPDPLLTQELGIPNACNQCHADQPVAWAVTWTDRWYGDRMDRPSRNRARGIARAQAGDPDVLPRLLDLLAAEEIPAWRATLVALLTPWAERPEASRAVREALDDPDPLVRAAAARVLGTAPADPAILARLQRDSVRVVRIEAGWTALRQELPVAEREEVLSYLHLGADQPAGALRMAQLALAEHRSADAESWGRKATAWDPSSSETRAMLGSVLHALGKTEAAAQALEESIEIDPDRAESRFTLALLYGEIGREAEMIPQLERAVALSPGFARAWYNLGLVYAQQGRREDALGALDRAASLMPESAEAPFARATLLVQVGDLAGAEQALRLAIQRDPSHADAARMLRDIEAAQRP
jgi:tetratricopeptide (TPR) repeat protein